MVLPYRGVFFGTQTFPVLVLRPSHSVGIPLTINAKKKQK